LWTFEDCKKDPSINFTAANEARVALHKIIRHNNGTMITSSAVKSITSRARPIVSKLLEKVSSHIQHKDIGKVYFWTTYPTEWDAACQELESTQPLLKLCSGHWKAEFVLGQVIKSTKRGKRGGPVMMASRSPSPKIDTVIALPTPIMTIESESHNDLIPKERKFGDRAPSPLPILDDMATTPPATKKSRKGKEVEKPSSKATKASSKKKPRSEYTYFSNVCSTIHTTLAFANITSGLGTGIREDATPGPSSQLLDSTAATSDPQSTAATSDPQPAAATSDPQSTVVTSDPLPATATSDPQPTVATSDPQPTGISAIPEISTVHLIHVAATCRFRVSQR
jgi:hypothetical protein